MSQEIRNSKKKSPGGFPTGLWFSGMFAAISAYKIP
jgi:hypothetical protein